MEVPTTDFAEMKQLGERWRDDTEGKRSRARSTFCIDRDDPNKIVAVIEFESYEEAMRNSDMHETQQFAEQVAKLANGPITFRNLDVREEWAD
jgi:hypothetical protein